LQYAETDENINKGIAAYETALTANNKKYTIYIYPGTQHAFNNDTGAARYNNAAADLAWSRTLAFFAEHLGAPPKAAQGTAARIRRELAGNTRSVAGQPRARARRALFLGASVSISAVAVRRRRPSRRSGPTSWAPSGRPPSPANSGKDTAGKP